MVVLVALEPDAAKFRRARAKLQLGLASTAPRTTAPGGGRRTPAIGGMMPGPTSCPCTLRSYRIVFWWWRRVWIWSAWSTGSTSGATCWRSTRLVSFALRCGWWPCGGSICTIAETSCPRSLTRHKSQHRQATIPLQVDFHILCIHLQLGCLVAVRPTWLRLRVWLSWAHVQLVEACGSLLQLPIATSQHHVQLGPRSRCAWHFD